MKTNIKLFIITALLSSSFITSAESTKSDPKNDKDIITLNGNNDGVAGFTYPDRTHVESDIIYNDILFLFTDDVLDFFDNDHEKLIKYAQGSVDLANSAFEKQDIPLRRNIAGIVKLPESVGLKDDTDHRENNIKIDLIESFYDDITNGYKTTYEASYISGILRHYPDNGNTVGRAYVSGDMSWITPFRNQDPRETLAHELGHNDGLSHNRETHSETSRRILMSDFSIGAECDEYEDIMTTGKGRRTEVFFSSPLTTNPSGTECGIENESDIVRSYKEAIATKLPDRRLPFANNQPTPEKTGEVTITALTTSVVEGETIQVELFWQGAEIGDAVQVILRREGDVVNDVDSFMQAAYFDGENTTTVMSIPTKQNTEFSEDKTLTIELIYAHKINLGNSTIANVTLTSDDAAPPPPPKPAPKPEVRNSSSGGSIGWSLLLLAIVITKRRF